MKQISLTILITLLTLSVFSQVHDTGNKVGIGTTNPTTKLDIMGSLRVGSDSEHVFQITDDPANNLIQLATSQRYTNLVPRNILFRSYGSSSNSSLLFMDALSGHVGIGNLSPDYNLHIKSASNANLLIEGTGTGYADLRLKSGTDSDIHGWQIWTDATNNYLDFYHAGSKLTLLKNGDLSLGQTYVTDPGNWGRLLQVSDDQHAAISVKDNNGRQFEYGVSDDLLYVAYDATAQATRMVVDGQGNVGIGTTNPSQKLEVNGTVYSREVKVDIQAGTGPDYVFEEDYDLTSLEEIEAFIQSEKHLPEVPSAKEMEANGVQLGEMNMLLLKKIEELTLHLIAENKENEKQRKEIEELKAENEELKTDFLKRIKQLETNQ